MYVVICSYDEEVFDNMSEESEKKIFFKGDIEMSYACLFVHPSVWHAFSSL